VGFISFQIPFFLSDTRKGEHEKHHCKPVDDSKMFEVFRIFEFQEESMITEKEKEIIIQEMAPYEQKEIGVFENNTESMRILYSLNKPCGWDFIELWNNLEEKLRKKIDFIELSEVSIQRHYLQKQIAENKEMFYYHDPIRERSENTTHRPR